MSEKSSFERMAAVNVNDHIEKKNNLSYLSWAWALDQLMRQDPEASWDYAEPKMFGDTMMVYCTVTAFGKARTAHLPVMDYKNKPIPNPDAFAVNTAMQRCFVKAIAMHGLGLYIYAGEDLPLGEEEAKAAKKDGTTRPAKNTLESAKCPQELTPEEFQHVKDTVKAVMDWLAEENISDAVLTYDNANFFAEQQVFFWTFFDSKQRTAMKAENEKLIQQHKKAA
jgi:hypothetical protein